MKIRVDIFKIDEVRYREVNGLRVHDIGCFGNIETKYIKAVSEIKAVMILLRYLTK